MTLELYLWLVPVGALVVAGFGILLIDVSSRRLEARLREEAKRPHAAAE